MLMLPISKNDQRKQKLSNMKQIEVQNYVMFPVRSAWIPKSSIAQSAGDYDTSFPFAISPLPRLQRSKTFH